MRPVPLLLGAGLAALVAGCSTGTSGRTARLACPEVIVAPDLDTIAHLRPGGSKPEDVETGARITSATRQCHRGEGGITANLRIAFLELRSTPAVEQTEFPYFVAVANGQRDILQKRTFQLKTEFVPRQNSRNVAEEITVHIPTATRRGGTNDAIIVGFQLTPEQLKFNRERRKP